MACDIDVSGSLNLMTGTQLFQGDRSINTRCKEDIFKYVGQRFKDMGVMDESKYVAFYSPDKQVAKTYSGCPTNCNSSSACTNGWTHSFKTSRDLKLAAVNGIFELVDTEEIGECICGIEYDGIFIYYEPTILNDTELSNRGIKETDEIALCDPKTKLTYLESDNCASITSNALCPFNDDNDTNKDENKNNEKMWLSVFGFISTSL